MPCSILYYPTIDIKDGDWLRSAVLYWDKIGSIVPTGCEDILSAELRYLEAQNIYQQVQPLELFYNPDQKKVCREFVKESIHRISGLLARPALKHAGTRWNNTRMHLEKMGVHHRDGNALVFYSKLPHELVDFFEEMHLIQSSNDGMWVVMPERIADTYMSILAKYLARMNDNMAIGTDTVSNMRRSYCNASSTYGDICYEVNLSNILPTPNPDIGLEDIILFRNQRRHELLHFREVIDDMESQLGRAENEKEIGHLLTAFAERFEREVHDIDTMLRDNRIRFRHNCFKSFMQIQVPAAVQLFTNNPKLTVVAAAANLGIHIRTCYLNLRKENNAVLSNTAFSYLYHGQKAGVLRRPDYPFHN